MEGFDQDKIDDYLLGNLSEEARQHFVQQMQSEQELAEMVEQKRDFLQGIELFGEQQFVAELKKKDAELATEGFFLTEEDIDNYINNTSDESTTSLVERRMQADDDFAKEVAERMEMAKGINVFGEQDFLQQLQQTDTFLEAEGFFKINNNQQEQPTAKVIQMKPRRRRFFAIAATISGLLIVVGIVLQFFLGGNAFENNFVAYQDELSPFLTETGFVRPDYLDILQEGMNNYAKKNYTAAQANLKQYLQTVPTDDQFYTATQFYLVQTYLIEKQTSKAIPLLEILVQKDNFQWSEEVKWYLALSYLDQGQEAKAQSLLRQLLNSEKYAAAAKELL